MRVFRLSKDPEERENWFRITTRNNIPDHSHKKQKDSMETQALLMIFWFEFEIPGLAIDRIHQNNEKWWLL